MTIEEQHRQSGKLENNVRHSNFDIYDLLLFSKKKFHHCASFQFLAESLSCTRKFTIENGFSSVVKKRQERQRNERDIEIYDKCRKLENSLAWLFCSGIVIIQLCILNTSERQKIIIFREYFTNGSWKSTGQQLPLHCTFLMLLALPRFL